ncbi:MAG: hypothetical protein M1816_001839 [Peltula sp. TS41687]|nr:MAG: hypothetical protein M1816_001839 [Peltula sp. TS41687]
MASSFEKSVKGGTKIKLAAPKSKYVEHILVATHTGEAGVAEIFRALQNRLRDSTWTIVFKGLIIVHMMIREGEPDVTLRYLATYPRKLGISHFSDVQAQGRNIRNYAQYLLDRARAYRDTKFDFVRSGEGRLKKLPVDKGLLRETENVQYQIGALLKCDVLSDEPENEITLTAFRLLVTDLLALFYVMNEGVINILEHFFEMSKPDAERALSIYKIFSRQTNHVVEYLSVARHYEHATRLEVPSLKHAPTSLTSSLEEYTQDPDFEINRRQYLAQLEAKKGRSNGNATKKPFATDKSRSSPTPTGGVTKFPSPKVNAAAPAKQEVKGPDPDLIDFFESIEQNQQPMAQSITQQPTVASQPQQTYPFQIHQSQQPPLGPQQMILGAQPTGLSYQQASALLSSLGQAQPSQPDFTGASLGTYPAQPQSTFTNMPPSFPNMHQSNLQVQPQPSTNPFRQSLMPNTTNNTGPSQLFVGGNSVGSPTGYPSSNPFTRPPASQNIELSQPGDPGLNRASSVHTSQGQPYSQPSPSAFSTSTNPFLRPAPTAGQQTTNTTAAPIASQPTGSTNPFRQSMFQQGQGTMGGLEQLPTIPVFPRSG